MVPLSFRKLSKPNTNCTKSPKKHEGTVSIDLYAYAVREQTCSPFAINDIAPKFQWKLFSSQWKSEGEHVACERISWARRFQCRRARFHSYKKQEIKPRPRKELRTAVRNVKILSVEKQRERTYLYLLYHVTRCHATCACKFIINKLL